VIHALISWLIGALALWLVARIIPGIQVKGYGTALIATVVIALVNFFIGWPVRILFSPITFLTLGLFRLVINAFLLKVAALFTPGFAIKGFLPAFLGSLVLTILEWILRAAVFSRVLSGAY
jgi:putative membrane protein